jgi:hypothetical protein
MSRQGYNTVDSFLKIMLMTNTNTELPEEWTKKPEEDGYSTGIFEYQRETADETTFVVSVISKTDNEEVRLRLSTIDRTSAHMRHDYLVDEYETVEDAVEGAQSFIDMFSQWLQDGSISSTNPEIEAINEIIETFRGEQALPLIGRLLRRFR